jgi:hypothetical protein
MTEPIEAGHLLRDDDLRVVDGLGPVEILVGVCGLNQARTVVQVVEAAAGGLAGPLADRKAGIVVVEAGFAHETLDAVGGWLAGRAPRPPVCCIRIAGPPGRSRAILGALAVVQRLDPAACALVDAGLVSLTSAGLGRLVQPVLDGQADCVGPAYTHAASEGTLTTNLLAPMCGALYGRRIQQLLGGCAGLSGRVATRLLGTAAGGSDLTGHGLEIRLALDAIVSGSRIVEVHLGRKTLDPGLAPPDLATTIAHTVGPFFRLMDRYRAFWSEGGASAPVPLIGDPPAILPETGEIHLDRMVRAFKLGLKDLLPVWEQALRDETLALLYPLGLLSADEFVFPAAHWARTAFDFAVADHEQRLPRDHLLRALTPLYLGRVAAFLREAQAGTPARIPAILADVGMAFEAEKAGLAARWR